MVELITDKGPCNSKLRNACLVVSILCVIGIVFTCVQQPSFYKHAQTLVPILVQLVGNLALLFGALLYNHVLVLIWLIHAALYVIGWIISFFGVIFHYGGYREETKLDNVYVIILAYIVKLLIFAYFTRMVYSFWHQLRNNKTNSQHSVGA